MQRGLDPERAWRSAYNGGGPWWNAGASHMNDAYRAAFFVQLGLLSLIELHRHLNVPAEPPYTDPYVRWCGRGKP